MTAELEAGTVGNTSVKANRDGEGSVRMLDVELSSPDDVQSIQLVSIGGEDFHPLPGAKVMVAQVGDAWKMAIVLEDGVTPTAAAGEKFLYSQDSGGAIAALIKLLNDGIMELNGSADFAVAYTDLKTAFDQLKTDFDALVSDYNGHNHGIPILLDSLAGPVTVAPIPTPPIGNTGIGTSPPNGANTTADMSGAKVDTVKLP